MHPLLARQVRKHLGDVRLPDEEGVALLLEAVSSAYEQAEVDRAMMERALELSSEELLEANATLKKSLSLLHATLDSTADGILVVDRQGRLVKHNGRLLDLLGLPRAIDGWHAHALLEMFAHNLKDPNGFIRGVYSVAADEDATLTVHLELEDGRHLQMHTQPQKLRDQTVGRVWSFHDITDLKEAEAIIRHTAYHDPLTGLPNRALFEDRCAVALARAKRHNGGIGLFFIDLDGFKRINDTLGHAAGDRLLKAVGGRLARQVREGDTLARFGGDEFVYVVADLRNTDDARTIALRILEEVGKPLEIDGHTFRITASIGIAMCPLHGGTTESLIRHADTALYRAKDLGRNTFQIYSAEISARNVERVLLESELRVALDQRRLSVVYQPVVCSRTGSIRGLEALSRWPRDGDAVPPGVFVPIAEEAGIVEELGLSVFEDCILRSRDWLREFGPDLRVSMNVSPIQIQRPGFSHKMIERLGRSGIPAHCFELELTESALMESREAGIRALNELAMVGFRIALDDFGTGYSSLSQLRELPLTTLKIDRAFVKRCHSSPQDQELIVAMVRMARSLGLTIVAEGAEHPPQVAFLRSAGVDLIQGFATGRPIDPAAATEALRRSREEHALPRPSHVPEPHAQDAAPPDLRPVTR